MSKKLLTQIGFGKKNNLPFLRYSEGDILQVRELKFNESINFIFDTNERHCIGWFNPNTGENHTCPSHNTVETKYEQCKDCMIKTGFNPSFYHADAISANQEEYNTHPHILYVAYFSPDDIKIGISHAGRNLSRLLEQGARLAYVLDTFPSANVARHYEAQASKIDGLVDNVKLNRKMELLSQSFDLADAKSLLDEKKTLIEKSLQTKFNKAELIECNNFYFASDFDESRLREVINLGEQARINGRLVGAIGQIILCDRAGDLLALPMKRFTGYYFNDSSKDDSIELPNTQFSLF
ncbi:MAG: DUF2797 domain-containing protein [Candidatus Nanosyncoccaceae bacterium]